MGQRWRLCLSVTLTPISGVCLPKSASSCFKKSIIDLKETSLTAWSGVWDVSVDDMAGGCWCPVCV